LQDARFSENATTYTEYKSSYTAYIDSESAYREAMARKKTAEEAVTYAQGEYDKYSTAVDAGEKVCHKCGRVRRRIHVCTQGVSSVWAGCKYPQIVHTFSPAETAVLYGVMRTCVCVGR